MTPLFRFVGRAMGLFVSALFNGLGLSVTVITRVSPVRGWPGTVLTIDGHRFDDTLDGNVVQIGGDTALVMEASANRLKVLAGEHTASGLIQVATGGTTATAPVSFEVLPWPEIRDSNASGAPVFFHGPQNGTPHVGDKNIPLLVVYASGAGSPAVNVTMEMDAEMDTCRQAGEYWRQATYERTTFQFDRGPWVPLPQPRNAYVYDDSDIAWARAELLRLAKRSTEIVGSRAFCAHQGGGLSVADVAGTNWPSEIARLAPGWVAEHVVVKGSFAYVAAGRDGLIAVNISGAVPVQTAKLTFGAHLRCCDASGNTLVAAAREGGVEFYDISSPGSPIRRTVMPAAGADWPTCVRVIGTRAYVGAGKKLRVWDVTNTFVPFLIAEAALGDWALGLDVIGNTCVVGTDGSGVAIFDVTAGNPTPQGNEKHALRVFNVRLAGNRVYGAAGADGIVVIDISDRTKPKQVSVVPTGSTCYDVTLGPGFGIASLGASGVAPLDMSDPDKPLLGFRNELTSAPPLGGDTSLQALRDNITNAVNSRGLVKGDSLKVQALLGAKAVNPSLDFNHYQGFIVIIQGGPGRGQSGLTGGGAYNGQSLGLGEEKGFIWLPSHPDGVNRTTWGRKAHEIGHWFKMADIYTEKYEDGTEKTGDAEDWDIAGLSGKGALFCGHQADQMQVFDGSNVVRRVWNPGVGPQTEQFEIVEHGAPNQEDMGPNRIHLLELKVAAGMSYFVEVRRKKAGVVFDQQLPFAGPEGRVLVTRFAESATFTNTFERPTMLFGVLKAGESAVDAARLLRIEAAAVISADPLVYRVVVHWNEEPPPDPNGKFDLRITPWSTETWETPDIWINSPLNDNGPVPLYDSHEPGDETRPTLNGDKPWIHHKNTIFARISNTGVQGVSDVYVTAYVTSPPGIGDNGSWQTLKSVKVPSIAANAVQIVEFVWQPELDKHTCISVAVMPQQGEIEPRNNRAQENVANFDSRGSSSHEPVVLEAEVRSPFSVWRRVDLIVRGLPVGWHAVVDKQWVWVEPKGVVAVSAVIWTDLDSPRRRHDRIPPEAHARVEGWTDFSTHQYIPIGGILAKVRANKRSSLARFEVIPEPSRIRVIALLVPAAAGVPGVVEITDAAGAPALHPVMTDASGVIQGTFKVAPGRYDVQVFTSSTLQVAQAESVVRQVVVTA